MYVLLGMIPPGAFQSKCGGENMPHLTWAQDLWAVVGGFLTGGLLALLGGTGSALVLPVLIILVGVRVRLALGTAAVSVALLAVVSALVRFRRGMVEWPAVWMFVGPGVVGMAVGRQWQTALPHHVLLTIVGVVLLFHAAVLARGRDAAAQAAGRGRTPVWMRLAPAGALIGMLGGMLGIQGGFLAAPSLVLGGVPIAAAADSSVVSVGSLGIVSAIGYALKGWVDWRVVGEYLTGGLAGTLVVGAKGRRLLGNRSLVSTGVVLTLMVVSLYLIAQNVAGFTRPSA